MPLIFHSFQLLIQVLNRITASSNLFDNVTRLHLPGLETVDRFPVLGAVAGILITLLLHGTTERFEIISYHCLHYYTLIKTTITTGKSGNTYTLANQTKFPVPLHILIEASVLPNFPVAMVISIST